MCMCVSLSSVYVFVSKRVSEQDKQLGVLVVGKNNFLDFLSWIFKYDFDIHYCALVHEVVDTA